MKASSLCLEISPLICHSPTSTPVLQFCLRPKLYFLQGIVLALTLNAYFVKNKFVFVSKVAELESNFKKDTKINPYQFFLAP